MFYRCYVMNYFHGPAPPGDHILSASVPGASFNDINKFAALVFQLNLKNLKQLDVKYLVMELSGPVHFVLGGSYGY